MIFFFFLIGQRQPPVSSTYNDHWPDSLNFFIYYIGVRYLSPKLDYNVRNEAIETRSDNTQQVCKIVCIFYGRRIWHEIVCSLKKWQTRIEIGSEKIWKYRFTCPKRLAVVIFLQKYRANFDLPPIFNLTRLSPAMIEIIVLCNFLIIS